MLDFHKKSISPCSVVLTRCDINARNSRTDLVTLDDNLLPKMKYMKSEMNDTNLQKKIFPSGVTCILCKNCDDRIPIGDANCTISSSLCQLCELNAKAADSTNLGDDSNGSKITVINGKDCVKMCGEDVLETNSSSCGENFLHNRSLTSSLLKNNKDEVKIFSREGETVKVSLQEKTTEEAYLKNKSFTNMKKETEGPIDFQNDGSPIKVEAEHAPDTIETNAYMTQTFQIASNNNETLCNEINNEILTSLGNEIFKESHGTPFIKKENIPYNDTNEGIQIESFQTVANNDPTFYDDNNTETILCDNETFEESPDILRSPKMPVAIKEEKPDHDSGHSDSDNVGCEDIVQCGETVPFQESQLLEYPYCRILPNKHATSCQECGQYFASTELLKKHMSIHSNGKGYETMMVPSMSVDDREEEILSDHDSGESESDGGYCDDILQQSETGQILQDNLPKRFSCRKCHITFTYAKTVACHEWLLHGIPHPPTGCRYCKVPSSKSTLLNYLVIHCLECGKYFPSEKLLNEHLVIHSKGKDGDEHSSSRPFSSPDGIREKIELLKCVSCEELFVNLSEIREHNCGGKAISSQNGKKGRLNILSNANRISDVRKRKNTISGLSQDLINGSSKKIAIEEVDVQPLHDSDTVEVLYAGTTESTINKNNLSSTEHINTEPHKDNCSNDSEEEANMNVGQWSNVTTSTPTVEFESANYVGIVQPSDVTADSENDSTNPICKISSCTSLVPKQEDFLEEWPLPNNIKTQVPNLENDKPIICAPMINESYVKSSNIRNCGLCGLVCKSRSEFLNHTAEFHPQKTKVFNHKQIVHIDEDLGKIHRQNNFVCNICDEKFNVHSALSHHEVTVHMTQELTEAGYEIVMLCP